MEFFSPQNTFKGQVSIEGSITADNHAVTKQYLEANAIVGIHSESANYAELVDVNGEQQLKLKPLTITDVAVDTTAASLSAWITANYTNGDEKQEGDIIVLTGVSGRAQTFIHNGGTAGDANDWAEIEGADVTDAEVRGALSASNGINYNSSTGLFTADQGEIRGFFSNGSGLSYDSSNGVFSLNVDTDGISEGNSNLYYSDSRSRAAISVTGNGISYDNSTGVISLAVDTDDVVEGANATNLFFTEQRVIDTLGVATAPVDDVQLATFSAQGDISVLASDVIDLFGVSGSGLSFSNGDYSLDANTDLIPESANPTNKYFTDARARGAISVDTDGLAYNSSTGVIALTADTDDIAEGANPVNKYFTDARARAAVGADTATGNLLTYNSSTGDFRVAVSSFRKTFAPQDLTANTFVTLNHALGEKIVHVSAYDSSGNLVQLDVQLVDTNNCKVKSVVNVTGLQIVVSL